MIFTPAIVISIVFMLIGMIVSATLRSRLQQYSRIPSAHNLTGREIAELMLKENGITDVKVISVKGQLTDHYNPMNKTVNLSHDIYTGANAAASAIAAHECGHALQHAKAYKPLNLRTKLVPIQNASGMILNVIMALTVFGGAFTYSVFPIDAVLLIICGAYGAMALFSFVTLPVEFDASKRALNWLESSGISTREELVRSKNALKWAAMTYVVAALGALTTVLYYVSILLGRRSD